MMQCNCMPESRPESLFFFCSFLFFLFSFIWLQFLGQNIAECRAERTVSACVVVSGAWFGGLSADSWCIRREEVFVCFPGVDHRVVFPSGGWERGEGCVYTCSPWC
ncbi:hypothetical protein ISCGN_030839 [Ixodes scapularis]